MRTSFSGLTWVMYLLEVVANSWHYNASSDLCNRWAKTRQLARALEDEAIRMIFVPQSQLASCLLFVLALSRVWLSSELSYTKLQKFLPLGGLEHMFLVFFPSPPAPPGTKKSFQVTCFVVYWHWIDLLCLMQKIVKMFLQNLLNLAAIVNIFKQAFVRMYSWRFTASEQNKIKWKGHNSKGENCRASQP